ncbi:MAG: hypothetical protein IJW49_11195 [Clostridia bacterium]|nr:hypothetical protein [Clostridia bacterium]
MAKEEMDAREEKEAAGKIVVKSPFLKWLDNFWYHHKWGVIIGALFLLTFIVCFAQCASRDLSDVYVTFAGGASLDEEAQADFEEVLNSVAKKTDETKDVKVGISSHLYYSAEELDAQFTDEKTGEVNKGDHSYTNAVKYNADRLGNVKSYFETGECAVWFLSEAAYNDLMLTKNDFAASLKSSLGYIPDGAYDEYAVYLVETEFYEYYQDKLKALPEDTLIVLTIPLLYSNEKTYEQSKALYRAILNFEAP